MDMEEVLDARMIPDGADSSICLNSSSFSFSFSVEASTTRSAPFTPLTVSVLVVNLMNSRLSSLIFGGYAFCDLAVKVLADG